MESAQEVVYAGAGPGAFMTGRRAVPRARGSPRGGGFARPGRGALRLAFVSDLHIGPLTSPRLLDNAFAALAALCPDVLVLGGDYVSLEVSAEKAARRTRLVASVTAATKVAVLGNHDLWTDDVVIARALETGGARVLVNAALTLPPPHDDVALVGLDEPWSGAPDAARAFSGVTAPVRIAVTHAPEWGCRSSRVTARCSCSAATPTAARSRCGTAPSSSTGRWAASIRADFYEVSGQRFYVSRGVGNVDLPVRWNAAPEVALLTIS